MDLRRILKETKNTINCNENDYIDNIKVGNNDFVFKETTVKSFFVHDDDKRIFVFLSAVGTQRDCYPIFHRVSWHDKFKGIKLYFDDPTRFEINFAPCFYFGNKNNNYLSLMKEIIDKLQTKYGISNSDITFISSSNGGFGIIYLAEQFPGSSCISLCPQLDVKLYLGESSFEKFKEMTGIGKGDIDKGTYERLNLYRIGDSTTTTSDNNRSKYIIYSNVACLSDKAQIESFCQSINYKYKLGLNKVNDNLYLLIVSMHNIDPHAVQPNVSFCAYLSQFFWSDSEERRITFVQYFINMMAEVNQKDFKYSLINSLFCFGVTPSNVSVKIADGSKLDIFLGTDVYIRFSGLGKSLKMVKPSVRFRKSIKNLDLDKVYQYVKDTNNYIGENDAWVNIWGQPLTLDNFKYWFKDANDYIGFYRE